MSEFDVDAVIIGGGLGGLAAGATLAKKGFKVTLIESHDRVGGYATNFKRKNHKFEVAIHMHEGNHPFSLVKPFFEFIDVHHKINLLRLPQFYSCSYQDDQIEMPDSLELARERLIQRFPQERAGIEFFFRTMVSIIEEMHSLEQRPTYIKSSNPLFSSLYPHLKRYWNVSIGAFLDSIVKTKFLKVAILANLTFYHDDPYQTNMVLYMTAQAVYFMGGVYYVQGGTQNYVDALADIIRENGGSVLLKHEVTGLKLEGHQLKSVQYQKKSKTGQNETQELSAKYFVANCSLKLLYGQLIKDHPTPSYVSSMQSLPESVSASCLYITLNKALSCYGPTSYLNIFIDEKSNSLSGSLYDRSLGLVDYGAIDSKLSKEGSSSCDIICIDKYDDWKKLTPNEYKLKKEAATAFYLQQLNEKFPGVINSIDSAELATPLTMERFTANTKGAIYGYRMDNGILTARETISGSINSVIDPGIKNLFAASAWQYVPGFCGTQVAGYRVATQIAEREGRL